MLTYHMPSNVLKLSINTRGRDFIVGDIHGMFDLLDRALSQANFDTTVDRLISVGDLVNKGPHSERCLDFLEKPWFYAVRGNHEDYVIKDTKNGLPDDTPSNQKAYKRLKWIFNMSAANREKMLAAFENLPIAIELETKEGTFGIVHADVPHRMSWDVFKKKLTENDDATIRTALLSRNRVNNNDEKGIKGVARVFFGHTAQTDGIKKLGNCYFIDTGAVYRKPEDTNTFFGLTLLEPTASTAEILRHRPESPHHIAVIRA